MRVYLCLICLGFLLAACKQEPNSKKTTAKAAEKITLPTTPSEVAQQWVEAFYNDDFAKAVALGTENTRMMIDSVKQEIDSNAINIAFKIYNMNCETIGDSSFCAYVYQEATEDFQEYVNLLKVNGQWLVNESWETETEEELEMQELIREELEKIFEEDRENKNNQSSSQ